MHSHSEQVIARFWSKVQKGKGDNCWTWTAGRFKGRYGIPAYGAFYNGERTASGFRRNVGAHCFSMELHIGRRLKKGEWVLHHCDNQICVNPAHLFIGNCKTNAEDCWQKGRYSKGKKHSDRIKRSPKMRAMRGEGNHQSKLKKEEVIEMRRAFENGEASKIQLARKHKLHHATVLSILNYWTWKYV